MEALEILEDLKHVLFQDFTKWRGYSRRDFSKAIAEVEALEQRIKELETENAKLKEPKGCNGCNNLADNVCNHPGIPEFYTPQYINYSGCELLEPKAP